MAGGIVVSMLTVKDTMTLDFERAWWKFAGAKEQAIRDTFSESATRYYQRLHHLIEQPDALAYDAQLVNRLRRLQAARRAQRTPGR